MTRRNLSIHTAMLLGWLHEQDRQERERAERVQQIADRVLVDHAETFKRLAEH